MTRPTQAAERISAYLDGELSPQAAADLQERASRDEALAAELRSAQAIDEGLRRLFAVTDADDQDAPLRFETPAPPRSRSSIWRRPVLPLAAALVVAVSAWAAMFILRPPLVTNGQPIYAALVEDFLPYAKCNTPESFADYAALAFGKAATLAPPGPGVELLGWRLPRGDIDPNDELSDRSRIMIAYVEGDPVVVVMDESGRDAAVVRTEPASGLNTFARTIEGFVLYEITPRAEPGVINLISP